MNKKDFFESNMIKRFMSNPLNSKVKLHDLNRYYNYLISNGYHETEHVKLNPAITSRVYETYDIETEEILVITDYDNMVNYFRLQLETVYNEINKYIKQNNKPFSSCDYMLYYSHIYLAKVSHILADLSTYTDFQKKKLYRISCYVGEEYPMYGNIESLDDVIKNTL